MNDELEKGDILYYVTRDKLTIFEIESVRGTTYYTDRYMFVNVIDRITSCRFDDIVLPINIKLMDYFVTGYGIYTTREEVAIDFFKNKDFFAHSWFF